MESLGGLRVEQTNYRSVCHEAHRRPDNTQRGAELGYGNVLQVSFCYFLLPGSVHESAAGASLNSSPVGPAMRGDGGAGVAGGTYPSSRRRCMLYRASSSLSDTPSLS